MFYVFSLMQQIVMTASSNPDLVQILMKQDAQIAVLGDKTAADMKLTSDNVIKISLQTFLIFQNTLLR